MLLLGMVRDYVDMAVSGSARVEGNLVAFLLPGAGNALKGISNQEDGL